MKTKKHAANPALSILLVFVFQSSFSLADINSAEKLTPKFDEIDSQTATIAAINNIKPSLDSKDFPRAIEALIKAEKEFGKTGEIVFALGIVKQMAGRHEEAIVDFSEAILMDFQAGLPYAYRGISQHKVGEHQKALDDFNVAIELSPKSSVCYQHRAVFYDRTGQNRRALQDLDTLIRIHPSGHAYTARALCHQKLGDVDDS